MSRYDSNPFEEEEVNPFAVSSTPIHIYFCMQLCWNLVVGFEICGIGNVLAYGFVGFCCFVFDLDFVVRSVSGISFPRRIRVRKSQCGSRIYFDLYIPSLKINFLLGCREIRGNVKNANFWILGAIVLYIRFSFVIPFSPVKMEHNWNFMTVLFSFLILEWFHLLKRIRFKRLDV